MANGERGGEEQDPLRTVPLLVIAGVWSAYNVVLEGAKILNERRDEIVKIAETHRPHRDLLIQNIFKSDFVPVSLAQVFFCLLFAGVMLSVPFFVTRNRSFSERTYKEQKVITRVVWTLCGLSMGLALLGAFGFAHGLYLDHCLLEKVSDLTLGYF